MQILKECTMEEEKRTKIVLMQKILIADEVFPYYSIRLNNEFYRVLSAVGGFQVFYSYSPILQKRESHNLRRQERRTKFPPKLFT